MITTFALDNVKLLLVCARRLLVSEMLGNKGHNHGSVFFLDDQAIESRLLLLETGSIPLLLIRKHIFDIRWVYGCHVSEIKFGCERDQQLSISFLWKVLISHPIFDFARQSQTRGKT